ncbi:hypothetical protein [Dokdonella soli]|uniref:hypothetical protein n=1 Tax=Dokdonella soli TaxID=529810 RepID=UPI0031DFA576
MPETGIHGKIIQAPAGILGAPGLGPESHKAGAMVLKNLYHARGSDGKDYEVHVYVEPASHSNAHIERLVKICLADGSELRVLSKRRYEIVATGVTLEAHDPDAI